MQTKHVGLESLLEITTIYQAIAEGRSPDVLEAFERSLEDIRDLLQELSNRVTKKEQEHIALVYGELVFKILSTIPLISWEYPNIHDILLEVAKAEMSVFPTTQTEAFYTKVGYEASGEHVEVVQYDNTTWVIKDINGKVRKPIGYKKACLKKYLSQEE